MTVWYSPSTIFKQRRALRIAGLLTLSVAFITMLFFAIPAHAVQGVNQTISFQGRLLDNSGTVVPDGHYNMQFKIYQDGTGASAGNPSGTLKWTESYVNNGGTSGVDIRNGFFSVELGTNTPFGTDVDWNQTTLWLSMNVAGSAAGCTTFGSGACAADGEMLPMKRMTSTPFALNSGLLNGKTSDNFIQLAQGVQTDATSNTSSIFINKTASGNLIQLQSGATDIFTVGNTGNLTFGNNANKSVSISTSGADTDGRQLALSAGNGGSGAGSAGGSLVLQGGSAGGTNGNGGDVAIDAGATTGTGTAGSISIGSTNAGSISIGSTSGTQNQTITIGSGSSSDVTVGSDGTATSGSTTIQGKDGVTIATNGTTRATFSDTTDTVYFGNGVSASAPNDFTLQGTNSTTTAVDGGSLSLQGGNATAGDADGGNIVISGGTGSGTGTSGLVVLSTPTFSTVTDDANCYTSGAAVATSCTITSTSVNSASGVIVGFSQTGQTASLPDPTLTTAGRVLYIMAAGGTSDFTLSTNGNATQLTMRANSAATLMWNGTDWTITGTTGTTALQDIYNADSESTNVQIGSLNDGKTTLLTLDQATAAPTITDEALLGSMYYDTTIGAIQCYEAEGWGACSAAPDVFVSLIPEYSNAVTNGSGVGSLTSNFCSDALNINNGTGDQADVCGTNQTYNYYDWTSDETSAQTKSVYVTYELPNTFKEFVANTTSLTASSDSVNASASYQLYRNTAAGLSECSAEMSAASGLQSWQPTVASSTDDPVNCGFEAGDSIVIRINLTSSNDAHAYISNLGFVFSNK